MKLLDLHEMAAESFGKIRMIFRSNFSRRQIELRLPTHVYDRSVEGERGKNVTEEYLSKALEQFLKQFDKGNEAIKFAFKKAKQDTSIEVTFRYAVDETFINFPVVIKHIGEDRYRFTIKTVMIKHNFKTHPNDIVINL